MAAITYNRKSIPLYWHLRLLGSLLFGTFLTPPKLPDGAIWQASVGTGLHSPLGDCDFLGHKSNSTYFADLDVARAQHLSRLMGSAIRSQRPTLLAVEAILQQNGSQSKNFAISDASTGHMVIALGGVGMHFYREIKPYERFEIHSRILSWDEKWIYIISHFVGPNSNKRGPATATSDEAGGDKTDIRASSIARVVVKKGRLTIPPEIALRAQDLLPPREAADHAGEDITASTASDWTCKAVEEKRLQGLRLAEAFDVLGQKESGLLRRGLDDMHDGNEIVFAKEADL
ncbi:hypothetical protein MBLNU230_g5014t1 [Neophaeotheca triangularis]